jgi:hypothetical protein
MGRFSYSRVQCKPRSEIEHAVPSPAQRHQRLSASSSSCRCAPRRSERSSPFPGLASWRRAVEEGQQEGSRWPDDAERAANRWSSPSGVKLPELALTDDEQATLERWPAGQLRPGTGVALADDRAGPCRGHQQRRGRRPTCVCHATMTKCGRGWAHPSSNSAAACLPNDSSVSSSLIRRLTASSPRPGLPPVHRRLSQV